MYTHVHEPDASKVKQQKQSDARNQNWNKRKKYRRKWKNFSERKEVTNEIVELRRSVEVNRSSASHMVLRMHLMLRSRMFLCLRAVYRIFSCTCPRTWCYVLGSSFALAHLMLRSRIFPCACAHSGCYVAWFSLTDLGDVQWNINCLNAKVSCACPDSWIVSLE